jgi:hypothetical protein
MNSLDSSKLLAAASHGSVRDVEKLLNYGENLKVTDPEGNTALHIAAAKGHWKVVEMLLNQGADATISNGSGFTARSLAMRMIYIDPNNTERYRDVIKILDDPPVYVKEAKQGSVQRTQAAPSEGNPDRERICKYFKGHILQWFGNLSKEADYSVDDIIYKDVLTTSVKELQVEFNKRAKDKSLMGERFNEEKAAKKKELERKLESRDERGSRKMADAKKEEAKNKQKSDKPTVEPTEVLVGEFIEGPDVPKKVNTWIHLPANNVRRSHPSLASKLFI